MNATGTLYMAHSRPVVGPAKDGTFQLTMLLMDRISPRQTEPWRVLWAGPAAQAWWQQHQHQLPPGTPLQVQAHRIRAHQSGRFTTPETHATLLACTALPMRHPSRENNTEATA